MATLPTSGLTLHLDAKNTTHLYTNRVTGSGVPADGNEVQAWDDEGDGISDVLATYPSSSVQCPNFRSVTPLMLHSCLDFDGSTDALITYNQTISTIKTLTSFISASAATLIVAFYAESITNTNATASNNELIAGNSRFGLVTRDVSGVKKLRGVNFDGSEDSLEVTITTGATYIGILKHEGGALKLTVIDSTGAETAATDVASGNTSILSEGFRIGQNIGTYNGRIGELVVWNVALSGSSLTDAKDYFKEQWLGVTAAAPAVGSMAVAGAAPTLTLGGLFTMAPAAGSVLALGVTPTLATGVMPGPGAGSFEVAGAAPDLAVASGAGVSPAPGTIVALGVAPTLTGAVSVTPAIGALVISGPTPSLAYGGVRPGTGSLVFVGYAPRVPRVPVLPPLGTSTGNAIFQSTRENIFRDATWSGTSPDTSYSLTAFARLDPAARVLYTSGSGTVTATIASSRGDILVIPVTNADALTVTNGAGLSELIPVPTMTRNRIPRTIVCDLSLLEPNVALRTSTTWNFAFSCSTANLVVGAAIALYAPRRELLAGDFQWGGSESRKTFGTVRENEYGARYRLSDHTMRRSVKLTKLATEADLSAFQQWFEQSWGAYGPTFLWPDPSVNDAYLGTLKDTLEVTRVAPTSEGPLFSLAIEFEELSKGRPV